MTVSEYVKLSLKDCKERLKSIALYSLLIRIALYPLMFFSEVMNTRYIEFLLFSQIYENPDFFDIVIVPLFYFAELFAMEAFVTLPLYLLFFKKKPIRIKPLVKDFVIFKAIIFVFYSLLVFAKWSCYSISLQLAIGIAAVFSVFFKDMIKVTMVTQNVPFFEAIKKSFNVLETQKAKRIFTFFAVEFIFFIPYLIVMIIIIATVPIIYQYRIYQWLYIIGPLVDIFTEPLRISFHLNFFYPKTEYEKFKV